MIQMMTDHIYDIIYSALYSALCMPFQFAELVNRGLVSHCRCATAGCASTGQR